MAVGDLTLRHAVTRLYGLNHLPSEDQMLAIPGPWRPYRSLGVNLPFAAMKVDLEERG